jgi:hypothetical protein
LEDELNESEWKRSDKEERGIRDNFSSTAAIQFCGKRQCLGAIAALSSQKSEYAL